MNYTIIRQRKHERMDGKFQTPVKIVYIQNLLNSVKIPIKVLLNMNVSTKWDTKTNQIQFS